MSTTTSKSICDYTTTPGSIVSPKPTTASSPPAPWRRQRPGDPNNKV